MNTIRQGATFDFESGLTGSNIDGFTVTMDVMQYPGDTPAVTRALTLKDEKYKGSLTSAETTLLAVGQWFIHIKAVDSDEDLREPIKLYVTKSWL